MRRGRRKGPGRFRLSNAQRAALDTLEWAQSAAMDMADGDTTAEDAFEGADWAVDYITDEARTFHDKLERLEYVVELMDLLPQIPASDWDMIAEVVGV